MAPDFASLTPLFRPRSVAVLGASADPARIGGRPISYLLGQRFAGSVYPVNPNRDEVQGLRSYPTLADLPETPDVAIVAVPNTATTEAVAACVGRGVKAAVVFTAGFAEMSAEGAAVQRELVRMARAGGMRLLGPNCLGLFNAGLGFYATFSTSVENGFPQPGRIGLVTQSGAFGTHIFASARDRGIATPLLVTTGNEADVTLGECLGWMAEDPGTDVIAACAEGIREPAIFLAALERARANRKPVVMMKVGRSALGTAAAQAHTASVTGNDAVTDAVLRQYGVWRARTSEELLDVAYACGKRIFPARTSLGVITVSGGAGVLISDAAAEHGLAMPQMPAAAQAHLKEILPFCNPQNPVDVTAQVFNDMDLVGRFCDRMMAEGDYGAVLAFFTQVGAAQSVAPRLRAQLREAIARHPDRLWVLSVLAPREKIAEYEADGHLVFEDPSRAVTAIAAVAHFGQSFSAPPRAVPPVLDDLPPLPDRRPGEDSVRILLGLAGLPMASSVVATDPDTAMLAAKRLGFPVALKIASPEIARKSEVGGVLLDVRDGPAVHAGFRTLMQRVAAAAPGARLIGVSVAPMVEGGVECILGVSRDPVFGPVVLFGLGCAFAEVPKDVSMRLAPIGADEALEMIRETRGHALLAGARGRPKADIAALADAIARLSAFAVAAGPRLKAVEINPLVALPEGAGAVAVDAVIEV